MGVITPLQYHSQHDIDRYQCCSKSSGAGLWGLKVFECGRLFPEATVTLAGTPRSRMRLHTTKNFAALPKCNVSAPGELTWVTAE